MPRLLIVLALLLLTPAASARPVPGDRTERAAQIGQAGDLADLKALGERVRRVYADVEPAVVSIRAGIGQGSGVVITGDGYVLTAGHVSGEPGRRVIVTFPDGTEEFGVALGRDERLDSGLVKITGTPDEGKEFPHAEVGTSDDLADGQWLIALGHPGGQRADRPPVLRLGRLIVNGRFALLTDNTLVGGDSGGPLFDLDGRVVGVHSRIGNQSFANYHVPIDRFLTNWQRLASPDGDRPFLGIETDPTNRVLRVTGVVPDGPAQAGGVREGDVLLRLDGRRLRNYDDLTAALGGREPGDAVELDVRRPDRDGPLTLRIELGQKPAGVP